MSKIKEYINKIVENGNNDEMHKLSGMLEEVIIKMKESHPELYKKYKNELYGIANNYKYDEDMAKCIVEDMKPLGEYWSIDTIKSLNVDLPLPDFYLVMNSLANDYSDVLSLEDTDTYIKMAKSFINDEDAIKNKVWVYFSNIPKKD